MNAAVAGFGKMGLLHTGILSSIKNVKICAIAEKEKIENIDINISILYFYYLK